MSDEEQETTNLDRLLGHLAVGSLAARLASSQLAPGDQTPAEALKQVILDRLDEVVRTHEQPPNPID